jgi:hypothetical protein
MGNVETNSLPLWRYVHLDHFIVPEEPGTIKTHKRLKKIWEHLHRTSSKGIIHKHIQLHPTSHQGMDTTVPRIDLNQAVSALTSSLTGWLNPDVNKSRLQVVIGSPFSNTHHILTLCADKLKWPFIKPPDLQQILSSGNEWSEIITDSDTPLVIPDLEHFYLRHHEGLDFLRRILEQILSVSGRFLIGCDSWAWAYLSDVLGIDKVFPMPLVLDAFDSIRLQKLLKGTSGYGDVEFLHPDGRRVFSEKSDFLKHLSAYSRGIPAVALKILQLGFLQRDYATVYVTDWPAITLPAIPMNLKKEDIFVLHSLLLHNGLPAEIIAELFSMSKGEAVNRLQSLSMAGMIEEAEGIWQVRAVAYPAVRSFMREKGFLVDVL